MIYIGIDNGVSGSIGILEDNRVLKFVKTPTIKQLSYTKKKQFIRRVDIGKLYGLLKKYQEGTSICYLERPMVNPMRFKATASALRALEATLIVIEKLKIPYRYIDSKEWQKAILPKGLKGRQLKFASMDITRRLFPKVDLERFKDADGLLIAEYGRRKYKVEE